MKLLLQIKICDRRTQKLKLEFKLNKQFSNTNSSKLAKTMTITFVKTTYMTLFYSEALFKWQTGF